MSKTSTRSKITCLLEWIKYEIKKPLKKSV